MNNSIIYPFTIYPFTLEWYYAPNEVWGMWSQHSTLENAQLCKIAAAKLIEESGYVAKLRICETRIVE